MPSRKAEQIIKVLRDEIVSGTRAPGSRLPTYDALMEQFGVTRPTVARVVAALRDEGLVTSHGERSLFVSDTLPHHNRYLWVTSEQPGSHEWTNFLATFLELIEKQETGLAGEVTALVGVDGRENNPAYQKLCEVIEQGSAAGLFLMSSSTMFLLPVLQKAGLPRTAIWAALPHSGLLQLDFAGLIDRAAERLIEHGERIAVLSPHAPNLAAAQQRLLARGLSRQALLPLHVGPVGCEHVTQLLFDRADRPDALFVTDDNLVEPVLEGLKLAGVTPGRDVYVLAHCNWPRPYGAEHGIEHIGFDVREILSAGADCMRAQRAGEAEPVRHVGARFREELLESRISVAPSVAPTG